MKQFVLLVGIFFALGLTHAGADTYSWTDENGVKHYGNVDVSPDGKDVKKAVEIKKDGESSSSDTPQNNAYKGQIGALTNQMQNDPEIMNIILSLQNDPAFAKLLTDPAFMKAAQSGDIGTLMANPKILELLDNPKVKEINKKMAEKNQGAVTK